MLQFDAIITRLIMLELLRIPSITPSFTLVKLDFTPLDLYILKVTDAFDLDYEETLFPFVMSSP